MTNNLQNDEERNPEIIIEDEDQDILLLTKMGYKQELYRGFSAFMSFSFCFTAVAVISSITGLFTTAMATGGPAVIMWSWIIGSVLTIIVTLSLAEICSTYPSAGRYYSYSCIRLLYYV